MALTLEQFAQETQQSILAEAGADDAPEFEVDVWTRAMMDALAEAGEMPDGEVCQHEGKMGRSNVRVNGWAADYEDDRLDLFVSLYSEAKPARSEKAKIEAAFKQARGFLQGSLDGLHLKLEEASPAFGLAQTIHSLKKPAGQPWRVRIFLLASGLTPKETPPGEEVGGLPVSYHVRDIEWLWKSSSSGSAPEKIEIDLTQRPGGPLRCLSMQDDGADYQTYLAIVPGALLMSIYDEFGARLLERNVRAFLQAKGKINSGIRDTLRKEPHRFLAYNNGLTATAESVRLTPDGMAILCISDLQIVNGGQTTASIFHTARRDKADLSSVYVPLKLSVVRDPEKLDDFVSFTAQYANSQNKVNIADFSANAPFHRRIEELSRSIWAPPATGAQHQTRWFYERARGQHADARAKEGTTPKKIKNWDSIHPRAQLFSKTDLAKFEFTWAQRPHTVSRGAQSCFSEFTTDRDKRSGSEPDTRYFEHLCAKAILFRRAEKIVSAMSYGGYRANIVTYTLAYLCYATQGRINLDAIWKAQDISPAMRKAIETVSKHVHATIIKPPGGANVTQWCKNEKCWKGLREKEIPLSAALQKELVAVGKGSSADGAAELSDDEKAIVAEARAVSFNVWLGLSSWAKATDNLQGWQRGIAYSVGALLQRGESPSFKQANQSLQALAMAKELGFDPKQIEAG